MYFQLGLLLTLLSFCLSMEISGSSLRISGGEEVADKKYVFVCAIYQYIEEKISYQCEGTLIRKDWVLTSAQCVPEKAGTTYVLFEKTIEDTPKLDKIPATAAEVETIVKHPKSKENDIALLKLKTSVSSDKATLSTTHDVQKNKDCLILGWGYDKKKDFVKTLHSVNTKTLSEDDCKKAFEGEDVSMKICTMSSKEGPCTGDLGAPLMVKDVLIGFSSRVPDKCPAEDLSVPSLFTNVGHYSSWIEDAVAAAPDSVQISKALLMVSASLMLFLTKF